MTTRIFHKPEISSEETLAAFDEIVQEIQQKGISDSELAQLKVKWRSDYFATLESGRGGSMPKFGLMHLLAGFTLFDGDPKLVNTILDGFLAVTTQQVQEAARSVLQSRNRAIVFRKPVEKSAQEAA
jgi:predicted Zn-dependent peptidase